MRALGGLTGDSVGPGTDNLVVGEEPGSKLEEARSRGITILTEDAFGKLIRKVAPTAA